MNVQNSSFHSLKRIVHKLDITWTAVSVCKYYFPLRPQFSVVHVASFSLAEYHTNMNAILCVLDLGTNISFVLKSLVISHAVARLTI